jgi:hypothetical protein
VASLIERLWLADTLAIKDGLYRADGVAYGVQIDASIEGGLKIQAKFSAKEFLSRHPDMVTSIDTTREVLLPHGEGYLCCGEGSHGSEGFFGRLGPHKDLAWVVYLEDSNPFVDIAIGDADATPRTMTVTAITALCAPHSAREPRLTWGQWLPPLRSTT